MYSILPYTQQRAKELGVKIAPSQRKNKKLMVIDKTGNVFHIGDKRYLDYPHYKQMNPSIAESRKKLYHLRHKKDTGKVGFYAKKLLW